MTARDNASTLRQRLGTLGDLQIPYGISHGSIVEYAQARLRELHWPRTMVTLRDAWNKEKR